MFLFKKFTLKIRIQRNFSKKSDFLQFAKGGTFLVLLVQIANRSSIEKALQTCNKLYGKIELDELFKK